MLNCLVPKGIYGLLSSIILHSEDFVHSDTCFFFSCLLQLRRSYLAGSVQRCNVKETYLVKCAMDASYGGDMSNDRSGNIFFLDHLNFYNLHIGFWT